MSKGNWIITILFLIAFIIDLIIPDPLPFVDEMLLLAIPTIVDAKAISTKDK